MTHTTLMAALAALIAWPQGARAAVIQPGGVQTSVVCGQRIQVTDDVQTLTLEPTDPVVSAPCAGDGIQIKNAGSGRNDRSFQLDCGYLTMRGTGAGVGVQLAGPNLTVSNCEVEHFKKGIVAGSGATIEDCRVTDCTDDGLTLKNSQSPNAESFAPISVVGTRSRRNGGWGFRLQGNGTSVDVGGAFRSKASGNRKGGFLVKGNLNVVNGSEANGNGGPGFSVSGSENTLSGNDADGNAGAGIEVENEQCCRTNLIDTSSVAGNTGPGILFKGRPNPAENGFPVGFDTTPGGFEGDANGPCPANVVVNPFGSGICPIVKGRECKLADLEDCGLAPPPPAVCGNGIVEFPETCDGTDDDACPGECLEDCSCPRD